MNMKRIAIAVLLLFSALAWAASELKPADFTINVHVSSSALDIGYVGSTMISVQKLHVLIEGKKYELRSIGPGNAVLALGDYKAKLVRDEHKTTYDSIQVYEFLFTDNKTRTFEVIGVTE
jgi:hypothetical protein